MMALSKSTYLYILSITIQSLILIFSPILIQAVLIFYVFKKCIIILAQHLGKNLHQPIEPGDLLFISDDHHGKPHSLIPLLFILDGLPDEQKIIRDLEALWGRLGPEDGSRIYWKLSCYPVKWLGYWFWKKDESFSMENQVEFIKDAVYASEEDMPLLIQRVIRKGFQKNKPLWEVLVVPNYERSNKSLVVFKFSHALFDGLSIIKLYYQLGGKNGLSIDLPRQTVKSSSLKEHLQFWTDLATTGLYQYLKIMQDLPDKNCLQDWDNKKASGEWICSLVPKVPVEHIKNARLAFKSAFFDIVLAAVLGGIRKYILKHYDEASLPQAIHSILPVPKPNHPDNAILNHWYPHILKLPIRISNISERINAIKVLTKESAVTPLSVFGTIIFELTNTLPLASYNELITKFEGFTLISSVCPGGPKLPPLFGENVNEMMYWMPIHRENASALAWGCLTGNGNLRLTLTADKAFVKRRELLNDMANLIHQEFILIFEEASKLTDSKKKLI